MDKWNQEDYNVPIRGFVASKQIYLFNVLKKHQFSGELQLVNPGREQWRFYLYMGRLIYGTGGTLRETLAAEFGGLSPLHCC